MLMVASKQIAMVDALMDIQNILQIKMQKKQRLIMQLHTGDTEDVQLKVDIGSESHIREQEGSGLSVVCLVKSVFIQP